MSDLTNALGIILNWLEQHRHSDIAFLQPGLSNAEIDQLVEDLPLRLPKDIRELYQWKNGTKIIGDYLKCSCPFIGYLFSPSYSCSFYPLHLVIDGYRDKIQRHQNGHFISFDEIDSLNTLNVFFCLELTDTGYVVINDKTQEASSVVFQFCKAGNCTPIIKFASLTNMMLTIAETYENAYSVNTEEHLAYDQDRALQIWRTYNSDKITEIALVKLNQNLTVELLFEIEEDLIKAKNSKAVEPLIEILQKPIVTNEDSCRQRLAVKVLGELSDSRAVNPLLVTLHDSDQQVRQAAREALTKLVLENPELEGLIPF